MSASDETHPPRETWESIRKIYESPLETWLVAEQIAKLLVQEHAIYFGVDTKSDTDYSRTKFIAFVSLISVIVAEEKLYNMDGEDFVEILKGVLLDDRPRKPRPQYLI